LSAAAAPITLSDLIPRPTTRQRAMLRDAALVTGFALFTALCAQFTVHLGFTPVPITGQTLAVLLSGAALGSSKGAASQALYWVLGWTGLPFYAVGRDGHRGGWHNGTGSTMGYLVGFIFAAWVVGYLAERRQDRTFVTSVSAMLLGTAIIYLFGVLWLAHAVNIPVATGDPAKNAIAYGLTPFLIGDAIKLLIAGALTPLAWRLATDER
jgi:biotin transport system substrate-specific component